VYDTDGNILQATDDSLFPGLLSQAFSLLKSSSQITVTELGCGTGRNTIKLLNVSKSKKTEEEKGVGLQAIGEVFALDLSPSMLSLAQERWSKVVTSQPTSPTIKFLQFNALEQSPTIIEPLLGNSDLVISTLVLEHLPIDVFFETVRSFMKPEGGYLILTNMHADMGKISQAGFLDEETGKKVQGSSFVYEIEQVLEVGERWGFIADGEVRERCVNEEDIDEDGKGGLLGKRARKWIGCKVWFGCVMRFEDRG
jgi:SAM-dependent methyltransferase